MSTPLSLVGSRRPGPCNRHQKAAIFFQIPAPQFFAPVYSEIIFAAVTMQWFAVVRVDANNSALYILLRSCFVRYIRHVGFVSHVRLRRCVSRRLTCTNELDSKKKKIERELSIKIVKGRNGEWLVKNERSDRW